MKLAPLALVGFAAIRAAAAVVVAFTVTTDAVLAGAYVTVDATARGSSS